MAKSKTIIKRGYQPQAGAKPITAGHQPNPAKHINQITPPPPPPKKPPK